MTTRVPGPQPAPEKLRGSEDSQRARKGVQTYPAMLTWQRLVRVGLAAFVVTFAIAVIIGVRERPRPANDDPVDRADPQALLESRSVRITLGDGSVIEAHRQFAYDDGSVRLLDVAVSVPGGEDRTGFWIRGGEAAGIEQEGEWTLSGDVSLETADGLAGSTTEASYADETGLVEMPAPAAFEEGWMRLAGDAARYDRRGGLLYLDERAVVVLDADGADDAANAGEIRIEADTARIARLDGVMRFVGDVRIDSGGQRMSATEVVAGFDSGESRLDFIELTGNARILGTDRDGGQLREMSASGIRVVYEDGTLREMALSGGSRVLGRDASPGRLREMSADDIVVTYGAGAAERAALAGGARIALFGDAGGPGATIASRFLDLELTAEAGGIQLLQAGFPARSLPDERVTVVLPAANDLVRRIEADALKLGEEPLTSDPDAPGHASDAEAAPGVLDSTGTANVGPVGDGANAPDETAGIGEAAIAGSMAATFEGTVVYVERRTAGAAPAAAERTVRAAGLEAVLAEGLTRLSSARFREDVALQAGSVSGRAEVATYAPDDAVFVFSSLSEEAPPPRVEDRWGSIEATTVEVALDGPDIEATGSAEALLSSAVPEENADTDGTAGFTPPGLFDAGPRIYARAGAFSYEAESSSATFTGRARIWQGSTEVRGETIVLDGATGGVSADGAALTRTTMLQGDDVTGEPAAVTTEARADTFTYDHARRQATYETEAVLQSDRFTLQGDLLDMFLDDDARTLQRIEARDNVFLELGSRRAEGETLVYTDLDGRFDVTGRPVLILEETPDACRERTGRAVTFYQTRDEVAIDGQSAERTVSKSCG